MSHIERLWSQGISRRRALAGLASFLAGSPSLKAQQDPARPLGEHVRVPSLAELTTAFDFEPIFQANLPKAVYDYTAHGSETEFTMRRNRQAFDWVELVNRSDRSVNSVDTASELFGLKLPFPIFVAPTAAQGPLHPEGEMGMHAGATAASTTMLISSSATHPVEKIAAAAKGPLWYQHYPREDMEGRREVLSRAQAVGCQAVVVTVDTRSLYYERDLHDRHLGGLRGPARTRRPTNNPYGAPDTFAGPWVSWQYFEEIRPLVKVPLLVKGIVTAEDARTAIAHGVQGIVVSNHGGRACDYSPSTLEVLPEIVEAVQGRVPILIDSGIRRGEDVLKAVALGARGVLLGRAARWGLGAFGPAGVQRVLEIIQAELVEAMKREGFSTLASVNRTAVRTKF